MYSNIRFEMLTTSSLKFWSFTSHLVRTSRTTSTLTRFVVLPVILNVSPATPFEYKDRPFVESVWLLTSSWQVSWKTVSPLQDVVTTGHVIGDRCTPITYELYTGHTDSLTKKLSKLKLVKNKFIGVYRSPMIQTTVYGLSESLLVGTIKR